MANEFIFNNLSKTKSLKDSMNGKECLMDDQAVIKYSMASLYNVNLGRKNINEVRKIKKSKVPNKKRISLKHYENAD